MGRFVLFIIGAMIAAIAYGYWDAYAETEVDSDIRARVIESYSLNFDSFAQFEPFPRGQLFVSITWTQPYGLHVSRVRLQGRVMEGDKELETFNSLCSRGGGRSGSVTLYGNGRARQARSASVLSSSRLRYPSRPVLMVCPLPPAWTRSRNA